MNDASTFQLGSTVSRRGVLAGGAALTALSVTKLGRARAQAEPAGAQPVVLITGTSSGFGRLMAETFARHDLRVVATMRETEGRNEPAATELRRLADREGLAIEVIDIDVTDQASVDRGVAEALRLTGQIDILVNNAGVVVPGPTELQPVAAFNANLETNLNGGLRMFRAVAPSMRERGRGYLIWFSSAIGRILDPMLGGYSASKLAVEAAADALAYEEATFGIEVTIVQPAGAYPTRSRRTACAPSRRWWRVCRRPTGRASPPSRSTSSTCGTG
jgi:NAD(P)-dependent dehydrogenase (short-subunit alcohol dehydrogenase family)